MSKLFIDMSFDFRTGAHSCDPDIQRFDHTMYTMGGTIRNCESEVWVAE